MANAIALEVSNKPSEHIAEPQSASHAKLIHKPLKRESSWKVDLTNYSRIEPLIGKSIARELTLFRSASMADAGSGRKCFVRRQDA